MKKILSIFIVVFYSLLDADSKRGEKETKADNKNQAITIKHAEGETKLDKPAKK